MTADHVKPLLENSSDAESLCQVAELLSRGHIPHEVLTRMGRLTALQKPTGGVRGVVARGYSATACGTNSCSSNQDRKWKEPQHLSNMHCPRAGCECIAHALQALTDQDPQSTILSVDGIGAYDTISRNAMLRGLRHMECGEAILPFVLQFYGAPSTYLWEDSDGVVHEILQGEGGEQGDALMPALFALGQHDALVAIQARLSPEERLFAFLDDIYVWSPSPNRMATVHTAMQEELLAHTGIQIHCGKTQLWNRAGVAPAGSVALTVAAKAVDPDAIVWRGDAELNFEDQGVVILGTPLGHEEFVRSHLAKKSVKHDQLVEKILLVPDLQSAWILLLYCAATRANYVLRVVHPALSTTFAKHHDASLRRALAHLLSVLPSHIYWDVASLPFVHGGVGLRSAEVTARAAFWSSWADCMPMIHARHSAVSTLVIQQLSDGNGGFHVGGLAACEQQLRREGFEAPGWRDLAVGNGPWLASRGTTRGRANRGCGTRVAA